MNTKEKLNNSATCIEVDKTVNQVILRGKNEGAKDPGRAFTYDAVYDWDST
jgi:hypothetical protein